MISKEAPYVDDSPVYEGLVWISNVDRVPTSPNDRATREGMTLGPARPTRWYTAAKLEEAGIVGLYGPPLPRASAPPVPATPALVATTAAKPPKPAKRRFAARPHTEPGDTLF